MGIFDSVRDKLLNGGQAKENPQDISDQSTEEIELATFVKSKVEEVRQHANRVAHEGVWMTNIAYVLGFDSVYYDPMMRQFRPAGNTDGGSKYLRRNRIHANLILPAAQNRLARMLKSPPKYDVRPNSMSEEDKEAAKTGIDYLGVLFDKQAVNRKRIDLGMWIQQCGHAYVGVSYDDQLGECLYDPTTQDHMGFEGDVRIDVVSAFEGFADPLAKTFEDCSWFARAKVRKLDYFRTHYPEKGHMVKEEGAWLLSAQYEMRISTLNTAGPSSSGTQEQMKNSAIEISYYEKRSKKHPLGRHVVVANGVLLKNDDLPVGEIPYAKFDDVVIAGKYYSESVITHARPLQDQYNRTLAKRADWLNKMLAGKYIAAKGHGLIQEALNDQSGEVVEYDVVPGASEPHAMQFPILPQYAYTESKDIESKVYEMFGLSEVSRGQLPSASIPAQGIQLLLEQDETRIGIETEQHEHAWARVGQLCLKYADKFVITPRPMKLKKQTGGYDVKSFEGKALRKNFDVTVIRGSTVPNSKVLKRQEILNLYTLGLLGNPKDPVVIDKVLSRLEYGDIGDVWEEHHLDMQQILDDLSKIEQEIPPEVHPFDNHALHILKKNQYRKGEKYKGCSDVSKALLEQNVEAHTEAAVNLANPQLAQPPQMPPPPPDLVMQEMAAAGMGPMAPMPHVGGVPPQPSLGTDLPISNKAGVI